MASRFIPEELVMEILARVPAKLLVRLRCVCKSWYALTRNPKFISKHLSKPTSLHNHEDSIIVKHRRFRESKVSLLNNKTLHFSEDVSMPFFDNVSALDLHIYGPCDGIVCIYSTHTRTLVRGDKIALWNPTTRDFKALPLSTVPPLLDKFFRQSEFGIGFDSTTNEYKVVRISTYHNEPINTSQVEVYTLSTNSWRNVETIEPSTIIYRSDQCVSSTYVKGFYYWLWYDRGSNNHTILSFDMSKEVFQKISAPPYTAPSSLEVLQELNGSVALCVNGSPNSSSRMLTIWLMNDDDASGGITANVTWIKQYTVKNYPAFSAVLGFHKNGDLLMQSGDVLATYSPSTQEFEYYGSHERGIFLQVLICKESLVSLSAIKENEFGHKNSSNSSDCVYHHKLDKSYITNDCLV